MKATLNRALTGGGRSDDGFTLVEILVVIIIIGILAAIAVPIYINQRQAAVDAQTKTDVRNLIAVVETGRVSNPNASYYELWSNNQTYNWGHFGGLNHIHLFPATVYYVDVGVEHPRDRIKGSKTEGTALLLHSGEESGEYRIVAWNKNGGQYTTWPTASKPGKALVYESGTGQFRDSQAGDLTDPSQDEERQARRNQSL